MNPLSQQAHVAQQTRREKLRLLSSQNPLSPTSEQSACSTLVLQHLSKQGDTNIVQAAKQSDNSIERSGILQGYPGQAVHTSINDVVPVYNTHMISSDPYNFPTGAELLAIPGKGPSHLHSSASDFLSQSPCEGQSLSQGGFSCQSSVTSTKSSNWGNTSGQLGLLSTVSHSLQEASPTSVSRASTSGSVASSFVVGAGSSTRPFAANCSTEGDMATYLSGSNVQADAMQTLYLMNPSYTGYSDASNSGNMVLISPSTGGVGQGSPLGNPGQQHQQQHYIGFSLPPTLAQSSLTQQSQITAMSNSNMGHQNPSTNLFTSRVGNHAYNWNGGNELSFLPSNDVTESTQSLAARLSSVNSGQQSTSDMSHYSLRHQSLSSLHEQQAPMLQSGVALGLNMENSQASAGPGQGLSLSLSPQQPSVIQLQSFHMQPSESGVSSCPGLPHAAGEDNTHKGADRYPNKWVGGSLSSFRASSRDGMLGTGYQNQLNSAGSSRQVHLESSGPTIAGSGGLLNGSKYLKSAQQLLDEVVSVGRGIKSSSSKHTKLQSWMGPSSIGDGSFARDRNLQETSEKDGSPAVTAMPTTAASIPEQNNEHVSELTPAERQELQMKKAKLMAMLDEVDRRYRQYYNQMQIVVTSFESAAGLGAARTYTALALQTISKHFRCLRDAISGQIRATSRALGEEDISGQGRGETSRLRFVDQQLRQQRALQQLGMMQQHAWRPQRGLPERSVSVLRAWLFEHFLHPYPKDADKLMLARQTGLTRSQVSNWFINARVRLWKPMVEEMYVEETREGDMDGSGDKTVREEGENMSKGAGMMDGAGNSEINKGSKQSKVEANSEGLPEQKSASDHASDLLQTRNQSMNLTGSSSDAFLFHEKESMRQGAKKPRNGVQDSNTLLSPNSSTGVDFKSDDARSEDVSEHETKLRIEDRHMGREHYTISHNGLVQADHHNLGGFGSSYQMGGLSNRYPQEGLTARYAGNSGVSLTLGLQHCEGLSLSGAQQQHYMQGQGLPTGRRQDGGSGAADYYSITDNSAAHPNSYEAMNLQSRKRFATPILHHDFVA